VRALATHCLTRTRSCVLTPPPVESTRAVIYMRAFAVAMVAVIALVGCSADGSPDVPAGPLIEIPADNPNAQEMERIANEILGTPTSEADATVLIEAEGFISRVVERDGEPLPATMDYRVERFNLVVANDVVIGMTVG
jgi:hypothetical protein